MGKMRAQQMDLRMEAYSVGQWESPKGAWRGYQSEQQ